MNPRISQGTITPDHSPIVISRDEIEEKLEGICASAFRMLKTQLEEKRDALISFTTAAELIESKSDYYSTKALQKKLAENCRLTLNNPSLDYPLHYIEREQKLEYDSVLSDIDSQYELIRESVRSSLITIKKSAISIEQKKPPLNMHLNAFKADLINALQNAAEECFELFTPKGKTWTHKKLEEFTDIFGCVVRIFGSRVQLDKSVGYGLNFGQKLRLDGNLPRTYSSLASIKEMKLDDIEKMINQLISECYHCKESYYLLQKIKEQLEKVSTKEVYRGYIQFKIEGTFSHYLKSVSFLKKEKNIVEEPLAELNKQHKIVEMKCDGAVAQQVQEILKPLQNSVETYKHNTDKASALINTEVRNAVDYLFSHSVASYNDIASYVSSMQFTNLAAKAVSIVIDAATHKVHLAYKGAMECAAKGKKFANYVKWADESLMIANDEMLELKPQLLSLGNYRTSIAKKLTIAKEMFDGVIYQGLQASYKREVARLADLEDRYKFTLKDYNDANILPKAIQAYGEIHLDGAHVKSNIEAASQHLKVIPVAFQVLKEKFNILLDDVKTNKEYKLNHYQREAELGIAKVSEALKKSAENIALANEYKNKAIEKLAKAESMFPDIHAAHRESFDDLKRHFTRMEDQHTSQEKNLVFMKLLPDAMKDYSSIVSDTIKMQEDSLFVTQSCNQLSAGVSDIERAKKQAINLAKAGVLKEDLGVFAQDKLTEMATVLDTAEKVLKNAKQIMQREQQALMIAKEKYPEEIHTKTQELFNVASNDYALALTNYNAAVKRHLDACEDAMSLHDHLILAKKVENEKKLATEMRQFLLKTMMMNFPLWKPSSTWRGGVNYRYDGVDYCIPHGIFNLIMTLTNSTDHTQWLNKVVSESSARDSLASKWKYHFFHVRNKKAGQFYKILKDHVKLGNTQALQDELLKISGIRMPVIEVEEKHRGLVPSI